MTQPLTKRLPVVVEGMQLLVEHVQALQQSIEVLEAEAHARGTPILRAVMQEEAAKVLILIDFVRAGMDDKGNAPRQLKYFVDHVARGIYAEVSNISPATFGEVQEYVEALRPSRYLDGPNGFEWVYRNRIEASREEVIYVDYLKDDEGERWHSPGRDAYVSPWPARGVVDLVLAMHRMGLLTEEGMNITQTTWAGVVTDEETHWAEHAARNRAVLGELVDRQLHDPSATQHDAERVHEHWTFPLHGLDLRRREVKDAELEEARRRAEAAFFAEVNGPFE